jgi:ribosome-associated translation inhibitor RaiA
MHLEVRHHGVDFNEETRNRLERRVQFALGRVQNRVTRVWAHLSDQNGPRGGVCKCCRIVLHLSQQPDIVIEERSHDLNIAIDRAVNRAGSVVRRELGKRQSHR